MAELRALVVDDSKVGRLTMLKKLQAMGIQVDLTEAGQEALDYLTHQRPDLIFMDHMMPEMDGFEVTRRIKAIPGMSDIPVIMVSGHDDAHFVEEARAAGAIDAIAKPPQPGVLEKLLARLPRVEVSLEVTRQRAVDASELASVTPWDQNALRGWLEQQIDVALTPLRDTLRVELAEHFEARLQAHSRALDELSLGGRERHDEGRTEIVGLRAELQTIVDRLEGGLHTLRATSQASLEDHAVSVAGRLTMLEDRLEEVANGSARLVEEARAAQADWAQRLENLARRLADIEQAEATRHDRVAPALAEELVSARLAEFQAASLTQQEALRAMVVEGLALQASHLAQLQAQLVAGVEESRDRLEDLEMYRDSLAMPRAEANAEGEQEAAVDMRPPATPSATDPARSDTGLPAEMARLKRKLHSLTLALAIGGGASLIAVGMLLLKG